ncbi:MAG: glycosyl hydrolase [bacterium]|nr:glycosyl hydrolase [bacterium]
MKRVIRKRMIAMGLATVLTVSYTFTDYPGLNSPTIVYAAQESVVWESKDSVSTGELVFGETEDWNTPGQVTFKGDETAIPADSNLSFTMTVTKEGYDSLKDGYIKIEADEFQQENNWDTLIKAGWPQFSKSEFTLNTDGTYSAKASLTFDKEGSMQSLLIRAVGTNFTGAITFSDVKITKEQEAVLTPQDPTVVGAFNEDLQGWEPEEGYEYSNGNANSETRAEKPEVAYDQENQRLELKLDYSANAATGWSEAKIKKNFEKGLDVSNYNVVSFRITYPEKFTFATKIFGAGENAEIINKQGELVASSIQSLGNGMNTGIVKVTFKPNEEPLSSLTLGIIGQNTDFKGTVYIDDVTLAQADATENFVPITAKVKDTVDTADISDMVSSVKLVDGEATKETTVLASYLKSLMANDQVLFGHQNATFRSVRDDGVTSDVEDMVGTLPAITGIDSLSLSGCETSTTNRKDALAASVAASKKAYENGSIVTLSCHMPNFTNKKIVKNADGTYDFTACDFSESKDCSNNCADQILEGGAYNDVYNDYLDMIADYALELQKENIPILYRPFHENNGNWFWWGSTTSVESYKAVYRYMVDYLKDKGVHNLLYIYSPNGPIASEEEYLQRYPGDEYIDIVAFDYYDDYNTYPADFNEQFFDNLEQSCDVVASIAKSHGKIPAISETGCRVMRSNGDMAGLAITENPIAGHKWFTKIMEVAQKTGMPYYLVWANFDDANFFVPYKYNDTLGQELVNDFIDFYNDPSSIFANGTNFYGENGALSKTVAGETYTNPSGYLITPKDYAVILNPTTLKANIENAKSVQFVIKASETSKAITLTAAKNKEGLYEAALDAATLKSLGKTDVGTITLVADGTTISSSQFISFNKEKDVAPAYSIDDFEFYNGNDALLSSTYGTPNSAANCTCSFSLDSKNKVNGSYGGAFNYTLTYKGTEVWTGVGKALANTNYSAYNAFSMWVNPDGNGQKLVLQFVSNGEEFESYLSDFVKGTKAQYVTIPFSSFKGKQNGTFDPSNITKFAVWCNSIPENYTGQKDEKGNYKVSGTVTFDDIKTVKISDTDLKKVDSNGQIITAAPLKDLTAADDTDKTDKTVAVTKVSLNKTSVKLDKGKTVKLTASILPTNATNKNVTWSTSNSKVATVKNGVVTAVAPGTATITVTTKDGNKKATCKVTVNAVKVKKLTLSQSKLTLISGKTKTLKVTKVTPNDATVKSVTWKTSNSKVAKVSSKGKVTAVGVGKAYIYAVAKDGSKVSAKCTVIVTPKKVTSVKASSVKKTSLKLSWKKQSGVTGYKIYRYDSKKKAYKLYKTVKNNQVTLTKLSKNKTYKYKVAAYKKIDGKMYVGEMSSVKSVKTKKK